MKLSRDEMVRRMLASDRRDDGLFIVGVKTTGIYCLPSCRPPRKPKPENVEFYPTPEAARAAGLRPCRLCHPDEFYLDGYAGETLVEGLVARLAADPASFPTAGALATAGGISQSKLHALCRAHYHATPADLLVRARVRAARRALLGGDESVAQVAHAAGFESLSAFNVNFRKWSRLTPVAYRRLLGATAFELALPADYPVQRLLAYLGRDRASLTDRVEGDVYTAAIRVDDPGVPAGAVVARVEFGATAARCALVTPPPATPVGTVQLHERLLAVLGLTADPARFETQVAGAPELAPLIVGQRGLRVPQIADPFDAIVWAVAGQQVTLAFAMTLRRRLIERAGRPVRGGFFAPPTPAAVAELEAADLIALGYSSAKAACLVGLARAVVGGTLPLTELAAKSATRIERTLLGFRGIGPWSAHYLLMRAFGFLDCVPVGDTVLTGSLARFFSLEARPDRRQTLEYMGRFSPYRSLATFHLWQRAGSAA